MNWSNRGNGHRWRGLSTSVAAMGVWLGQKSWDQFSYGWNDYLGKLKQEGGMRDDGQLILQLCFFVKVALDNLWIERIVFLPDKYLFTAAAHTQGSVFISPHNDTCAVATQITRQRLPKPFTLSLLAGHRVLSHWVNDSLMAELVKQGMIRKS